MALAVHLAFVQDEAPRASAGSVVMRTTLLALILTLSFGCGRASVRPSARRLAVEPTAANSTLHSYQRARRVLARAIEVAGGEANIRRLRSVSLGYTGHRNMINQS